jgi:VanZ family protein
VPSHRPGVRRRDWRRRDYGIRVALRSRLDPWLPPLLLMAVIFYLSAQPDLTTGLGVIDLIARKLAHAAEYALLCFLWWRALRTRLSPQMAAAAAFAITLAYAATDEYHQTFVSGRSGSVVDVGIDALGAGVAAVVLARAAAARRIAA